MGAVSWKRELSDVFVELARLGLETRLYSLQSYLSTLGVIKIDFPQYSEPEFGIFISYISPRH